MFESVRKILNSIKMAKRGTEAISGAIQLVIFFILGASLLPTAFGQWFGVNQTGWDATVIALWTTVAIVGMVGLAYSLIKPLL